MPGDTMDLRVILWSVVGQQKRGFELTVLDCDDEPVGQLLVADSLSTQRSIAPNGREYLKHTAAGSVSPDSLETWWPFRWRAPDTYVGPVTFYVAACGADGDSTPAGDVIQTGAEFVLDHTDCWEKPGDVDYSGKLTAADIVYLVNYVFRGGLAPQPCTMYGDVNCTGSVTVSDVIELVRVVFGSELLWCDICSLWIDGTWPCPFLEGQVCP
jgi:hypothetical protein